jgi:hypothetical protein
MLHHVILLPKFCVTVTFDLVLKSFTLASSQAYRCYTVVCVHWPFEKLHDLVTEITYERALQCLTRNALDELYVSIFFTEDWLT